MSNENLVEKWFEYWETGDFRDLPITDTFTHTSPYGTIEGKDQYLHLVEINKDKFLGHRFIIHDTMYEPDRACVRYSAVKEDFRLEVSEWHYFSQGRIQKIVAYYNIEGEINEDRKIDIPSN